MPCSFLSDFILTWISRTNLVIILGMMQVSKRIPFDDPQVLNLVRAGYILSNVIIISVYAFVHLKINKKKGKAFLDPNWGANESNQC